MADSLVTIRRRAVVDAARCTGCGRCVAMCPLHLLSLETVQWKKSAVLGDAARCTGCRDCAMTCPFHAITLQRQDQTPPAEPPLAGG